MDVHTSDSRMLPTKLLAASSTDDLAGNAAQHVELNTLVVVQESEPQCSVSVAIASPNQQSRAAADMQLPPGWTKLTDDYGVSIYANASLDSFQYTHPALNAPPFSPDMTDYTMGHPAPEAPAWSWMMYLWLREVKSTHSVVGVLCAVSLFGRSLCAPPRDAVFQRRVWFRIWFMISSLVSTLLFHASLSIIFGGIEYAASMVPPQTNIDFSVPATQLISECERSKNCVWKPVILQFFLVSVTFGIYRFIIFRAFKSSTELQRLRSLGLKHVAVRGVCGRFVVAVFSLVTLVVTLFSCSFFGAMVSQYGFQGLPKYMMIGFAQGLLTELFMQPDLLKTAYLFATGRRKRVVEEKMEEIRNEVEKLLSLRAIGAKMRSKPVF